MNTYRVEDLPTRLQEKIIVNEETGCWEWIASFRENGYGRGTWFEEVEAHRAVYRGLVGPISEGLVLDHLCRNRLCSNPTHLEPVTQQVNVQRGQIARLNAEKVKEIRELYSNTNTSQRELANQFGVSLTTIGQVITGKTWSNVGGPISENNQHRRNPTGESSHKSKLSIDEVREIRKLYSSGDISQTCLAKRFNVSQAAVSLIVLNQTYTEIETTYK